LGYLTCCTRKNNIAGIHNSQTDAKQQSKMEGRPEAVMSRITKD
jgi:hypothetical protein